MAALAAPYSLGRLGVARQEQDARTVTHLRGWDVQQVYVDNDVSAFNTKVFRHEFERMLEDLSIGAVDGCVVHDLDRFARQPADLERAIKIFDNRDGMAFATVQGDIDLSSPDGRTMARRHRGWSDWPRRRGRAGQRSGKGG
jgi:site-specific DNA recombinase